MLTSLYPSMLMDLLRTRQNPLSGETPNKVVYKTDVNPLTCLELVYEYIIL